MEMIKKIQRILLTLLLIMFLVAYSGFSRPIMINGLERSVTCEAMYGFLPCTTEKWGQLFLIIVYQYLLSLGEKYVSHASDLFFKLIGPGGIFGAGLFSILVTIPQISLILVTGLSESDASAAGKQAAMGMSVLAGTAVFNLTLVWASCVAFGSSQLSDDSITPSIQPLALSLKGAGVITDSKTRSTARILLISMIPFFILQLPKVLHSYKGTQIAVLISLLTTLALFTAYCIYQMFQPWIQNRRYEYLTKQFVKNKLLRLLSANGKPNVSLIKEIYNEIDKNHDGSVSTTELRVLIIGIQFEADGCIKDDYVNRVMEEFDISTDGRIKEEEFVQILLKWISKYGNSVAMNDHNPLNIFHTVSKRIGEKGKGLLQKSRRSTYNEKTIGKYLMAAYYLLLGTAILVFLGSPLVKSVTQFAKSANISSFFIPYTIVPLTLNIRSAKSAITSARQKTQHAASLTLSQLYGRVFMKNMISLMVFLSVVYIRNLSWDVSAEVLVVMIVCTAMGLFTSSHTEFPLWTSFLAYLLYPISLLMLYILTSILGWS